MPPENSSADAANPSPATGPIEILQTPSEGAGEVEIAQIPTTDPIAPVAIEPAIVVEETNPLGGSYFIVN